MESNLQNFHPEVWGGLECTINRVQDNFYDQLEYAGHYIRTGDIEQFARLGIKKLRYPVLWERQQPEEQGTINWDWIEQHLISLRSNSITPIVGLLHHGSGPKYTDLLDPEFPYKLSCYAEKVARRFPWLLYYTPVNEPLTTARFSGLYGYWYPHNTDELSFFRMLINQVKGIVLSMKAVRAINPFAKLVQTEDLSKTHATPMLAYQAEFENHRRWLTWDLLCGKVNPDHYFWPYIINTGIAAYDLQFFLDNPCPPDIIGCNYYVTSERWLDEQIERYGSELIGGNGIHIYADTEAVRSGRMLGLNALMKETWARYALPMAVTECHINCSREEQLRWLKEAWDTTTQLRKEGIAACAVTAWSMLGARDWSSLLTRQNNHYETGVFDVSLGNLRPTALAKMLTALAETGNFVHPLLSANGWWNRGERRAHDSIPLLLIGKKEDLFYAFKESCISRSIELVTCENQTDEIDRVSSWGTIDIRSSQVIICSGGLQIANDCHDLRHVAAVTLNLLIDGETGLWGISSLHTTKKRSDLTIAI